MKKKLTLEEAMLKGLRQHAKDKYMEKKSHQKGKKELLTTGEAIVKVMRQHAQEKFQEKQKKNELQQKEKKENFYEFKPLKPIMLTQIPMYYDGKKIEYKGIIIE